MPHRLPTRSAPADARFALVRPFGRRALLCACLSLLPVMPAASEDCDLDGTPDEVAIRLDASLDLNENGSLDLCEIASGDLDLDERVDGSDVVMALLDFGAGPESPADIDRDGVVGFSDLCMMMMQFGPTARASVPRTMLGDLLAGASHLDIVLVGDSNVTFADGRESRGYSGGFVDELTRRGAPTFATGLLPVAVSGDGPCYPKMGSRGGLCGPDSSITVCDTASLLDDWVRGSTVPGLLEAAFSPSKGGGLRLDGRNIDWAFLPEGGRTAGHAPERIWLPEASEASHAFGSAQAGAFRLVVARMQAAVMPDAERAPLELSIEEIGRPSFRAVATTAVPVEHAGRPRIDACELRYAAEAGRHMLSATFRASDDGTTGPVGVLYRSMYRTDGVRGFAVSVLQNWAGGTTGEIAGSLQAGTGCGSSTLQVFLRELADRQRAAGGPGRVLVFLNMGVNNRDQAPAQAHAPEDCGLIIRAIDAAWSALGEDEQRLAFIVTASHDAGLQNYDPRATQDALRAGLAGDRRIAVIDVDGLSPKGHLASIAGYAGQSTAPNPHLSGAGYQSVTQRVIERVLGGSGYRPD